MPRTPDQERKRIVEELRQALSMAANHGREANRAQYAAEMAENRVKEYKFQAESRIGGMLLALRQRAAPLPYYGPVTGDSGTQYRRRDGVLEWYDPAQSTLQADVWVQVPPFLVEDLERLIELRDVVAT